MTKYRTVNTARGPVQVVVNEPVVKRYTVRFLPRLFPGQYRVKFGPRPLHSLVRLEFKVKQKALTKHHAGHKVLDIVQVKTKEGKQFKAVITDIEKHGDTVLFVLKSREHDYEHVLPLKRISRVK